MLFVILPETKGTYRKPQHVMKMSGQYLENVALKINVKVLWWILRFAILVSLISLSAAMLAFRERAAPLTTMLSMMRTSSLLMACRCSQTACATLPPAYYAHLAAFRARSYMEGVRQEMV